MGEPSPSGVERRHLDDAPVRVVSARVGLVTRLRNLLERRELLSGLISSDIRIKYKGSVLGLFWSMLSPALTLATYYLVFSIFLKNGIPNFVIYLFSGLVVWNLFQTAVNSATGVIVDRAGLVKKVSFPREILPLAPVGAALYLSLLQAVVLVLALAIFRIAPSLSYLPLLVPAIVALILFTSAMAMFLSAVNVYLRDMKHLVEVMLMAWFWATPVVYYFEQVAPRLPPHGLPTWLPMLNPMTDVVMTFQRALYGAQSITRVAGHPSVVIQVLPAGVGPMWYLTALLITIGVSAVLYVGALALFVHLEGNFAEEM